MNINTSYLGLGLKNPLIVSSSTLTGSIEGIRSCAEAGAGAIVLKSIFEEQILSDIRKEEHNIDYFNSYDEAHQYLSTFLRGNEIELYVQLIKEAKKSVDIPIIASINCIDKGEWTSFAKEFENAGADALELNIAISPFDRNKKSSEIEDEYAKIFTEVKKNIKIPVAVKLGNHFTNICNMAFRLSTLGAEGLVLFNRYYNPDIDIDQMKAVAGNSISSSEENSDTLRYVSLLSIEKIPCDLSAATGIHSGEDMIKQILAGASTVQVCSVLQRHGVQYIKQMLTDMEKWMEKHDFDCLCCFKGAANKEEDLKMFERLQYLKRNYDL